MTLLADVCWEGAPINNECNVGTNTAWVVLLFTARYARGGPGNRDRARLSANGSSMSMPATEQQHTPSWSNNSRRRVITRPRSLNCVLLTLQSNLEAPARRLWMHRAAEGTSTCPLRRVVSLPNSDLPAPPVDLATTTTHAPNHPLRTTTHGRRRCPAVSPGLCKYG